MGEEQVGNNWDSLGGPARPRMLSKFSEELAPAETDSSQLKTLLSLSVSILKSTFCGNWSLSTRKMLQLLK